MFVFGAVPLGERFLNPRQIRIALGGKFAQHDPIRVHHEGDDIALR